MRKKNYTLITHEPVIGELRYGKELGRNTGQRFIYAACEGCGEVDGMLPPGGQRRQHQVDAILHGRAIGARLRQAEPTQPPHIIHRDVNHERPTRRRLAAIRFKVLHGLAVNLARQAGRVVHRVRDHTAGKDLLLL